MEHEAKPQTGEINTLNSSAKEITYPGSRVYPNTRREALKYIDIGCKPSITKELGLRVISLYQDLGAAYMIPSEPNDRVSWLNRMHYFMMIGNVKCPEHIDFRLLYDRFIHGIMIGTVQTKGYSIKPMVDAFNSLFYRKEVVDTLEEQQKQMFPEYQINDTNQIEEKHIEEKHIEEEDEQEQHNTDSEIDEWDLDPTEYLRLSPYKVADLVGILTRIESGEGSETKVSGVSNIGQGISEGISGFRQIADQTTNKKSFLKRLYATHDFFKKHGIYKDKGIFYADKL